MNTTAAFSWRRFWLSLILGCVLPSAAFAGFPATEVFLPAVGRIAGAGSPPAQFYTTVWATNLTNANETFTFEFLKQGQANTSPVKFSDTLSPGQTKVYENIVEDKLGLSSAIGAARVTSSGEIMLSERIYNQLPGDDVGNSEGLFFAGLPKSFSISLGQSATIQGVDQGGSEDFRYNFALVETGGGTPTVHVALVDGDGNTLGSHDYILQPYEQLQPNVTNLFSTVSTINARLTATVTAGTGSVLLAGAQVANQSQDSSGFEMSFRGELLGSGGAAGVTSLNGLTGDVTLKAGSNVSLNKSGQMITISAGAGAGGSLWLPFTGSAATGGTAFAITNSSTGYAIEGNASSGIGVHGVSGSAAGVYGSSSNSDGVIGQSSNGNGVHGYANTASGVVGESNYGNGITGSSTNSNGVFASSTKKYGVFAASSENDGIQGTTISSISSGVVGTNSVHGNGGRLGLLSYGVFSQGDIGGTGLKAFVEPHPSDPSKEIRYVALEGPESGTYFRGSGRLVGGLAVIEVPESFRMVSSERGLTVVAMPMGAPAVLVCREKNLKQIVIQGAPDVEFDYIVNGVRKAFDNFEPVSENRDFVPRWAEDRRFVGGLPAESLRRLKANGVLNADGSINLETAHRLGWDRSPGWGSGPTGGEMK